MLVGRNGGKDAAKAHDGALAQNDGCRVGDVVLQSSKVTLGFPVTDQDDHTDAPGNDLLEEHHFNGK